MTKSSDNARPRSPDESGGPPDDIRRAIQLCQDNAAFLSAIADIHNRADRELAAIAATCMGGGVCCKFDLTDHRLYLTTGELALLAIEEPPNASALTAGRCPYQSGTRCQARQRRPLGCRTFFCSGQYDAPCRQCYETHHSLLQATHQRYWLPYAYVELTAGLLQLFSVA